MNFKQRFKLNRSSLAVILLLVYDAFAVNISYFLALWLRFDCKIGDIPPEYINTWLKYIPINTAVSIVIFLCLSCIAVYGASLLIKNFQM